MVTSYEYDGDGRLTVSAATTEAEWDDDSRGLALALAEYEAGLCPSCFQPLAETTDPAHEGRYHTGPAIRCHRCTATEQASHIYAESPAPGALMIPVDFEPPATPRAPTHPEEVPAWPLVR